MASIQQSINQATSAAVSGASQLGIAFSLTPLGQDISRKKQLQRAQQVKETAKQEKIASLKDRLAIENKLAEEYQEPNLQLNAWEASNKAQIELAELEPTEENIRAAEKAQVEMEDIAALREENVEYERKQAEKEAEKTKAKQEQAAIEKEKELASQVIRETIVRGGYEDAKSKQTMEFYKSLELLRQGVK